MTKWSPRLTCPRNERSVSTYSLPSCTPKATFPWRDHQFFFIFPTGASCSLNTRHRRRKQIEEKAKVVAAVWWTELIHFHALLAVLHQDNLKKNEFILHIKLSWCKILIASPSRNLINSAPHAVCLRIVPVGGYTVYGEKAKQMNICLSLNFVSYFE